MNQWRSFFANSHADIWTVIEKAVILAASDYPKEFKNRRSEIAEILFSRALLELPSSDTDVTGFSGSGITNALNLEENGDGDEAEDIREGFSIKADTHAPVYNDVEAVNEKMEEEPPVIKELYRIKEMLNDSDQLEKSLLDLLQRLENLPVTVEALKATEIGRQVNLLRKHPSKRVRSSIKLLVSRWKDLVDEWVKTAGDDAATIAGNGPTALSVNEERGVTSFPPASVEINQSLSYTDEETAFPSYREAKGYILDPFNRDINDMHILKPQIRSTQTSLKRSDFVPNICGNDQDMRVPEEIRGMQTYLSKSDFVPNICFNDQEMRATEERGSSSGIDSDFPDRVERRPESDSRHSTSHNASTLGFECKGKISSTAGFPSVCPGKAVYEASKLKLNGSSGSGSNCGKSWKPISVNKTFSEDMQTAQKLEIAKRKLHEGYQQAEHAKKQRTAQRLDPTDLPKDGVNQGKTKLNGQSRTGPQNWHRNQNRK